MYSKVDEKTRYDYPTFNSRPLNRRKPPAEALYASASQTYSLNSDDPYSSIAINRRPPPKGFPAHNVDDLYAKVNRKPFDRVAQLNGNLPSTSSGASRFTLQQVQPSTSGLFNTYTDDPYQMEESGSGSITSNESRQPSYRYLTVRESLGVIRERILRRNEENQSAEGNSQKEHYYSTISNDYESVRNEEEGPSTAITIPRPRITPINPQVVPAAYSGTCSQSIHSTRSLFLADVNSSTFVEDVRLPLTHRHPRSRIPLPINRRPLLRPATHSPKKANTSNNKIKSRSRSPLFLPVGSDYVSVLDLDEGKCWPLDRTL
ncbi:hypothetical protein M3Y99_00090000 [Aphelenchoides fujianensis]|nr:hypothetical protein M3Y99_00090000 [Aphelenchoides fujianensis]